MPNTLVSISGIDLSDYAVRGLKLSLAPIPAATQLKRTVNGELIDNSSDQFHEKYAVKISCTDQEGPGLFGVRPGTEVELTCLADMLGNGDEDTPIIFDALVVRYSAERGEYEADLVWELELETV